MSAPLRGPGAEPAGLLVRALAVGLLGGAAALGLRFAATEAPRFVWSGRDLVQGVAMASPTSRVAIPALGGLLAGTTHAPLTAVVMVFEMTLDYGTFVASRRDHLYVVDAEGRFLGTISKRAILSVYSLELLQRSAGRLPIRPMEPPVDSLVDEGPLPPELDGRTFAESRFRESHALALLLVRRSSAGLLLPDADLRFAQGDRLVVFGPRDRVAALRETSGLGSTDGEGRA